MGSRLTPDGVEDHYFCRRLDYCRGFDAEAEWTVASWMADQGFTEYDQGRREWLEILLKAGLTEELVVDGLVQDLFATLAYDLDRFRRLVFDPVFLEAYDLKAEDYRRPQDGRPGPPQVQLPLSAHPPVAGGGAKDGRGDSPVNQILRGGLRQGGILNCDHYVFADRYRRSDRGAPSRKSAMSESQTLRSLCAMHLLQKS